ncbi:MAG: MFS transporter [Anaerolineales bacterium]|nr:MAG: MFS transporter [Anaerolineales bacterium]
MPSPEPDKPELWRGLPRNVWAVTLTSLLTDISSEMLFNLLPIFLFSVLGVRTSLIGVIEGTADAGASLLKMASGWLSDRTGRRKPLAVLGYTVSSVVKPFLYFATTWTAVLAVRFSDRLGKGLRTAPRDALVADSVDPGKRGLAFGLHRAGDTAGAVIGLGIALAVILTRGGPQASLSRSMFQTVVLLSMIPAIMAVLVLVLGVREPRLKPSPKSDARQSVRGEATTTPGGLSANRPYVFFIVIVVLFSLGNSSDAFLILRAQAAGLSVAGVLGMMLSFNLVYAVLAVPAGALSDRLGRRRLLLAGWLIYALIYLGFALAKAGWQTWLLMMCYGIYYALTEGVLRAYLADLVPEHQRGTAYGIMHAAIGITALPASVLAGILWQGFGRWAGWGPSAPFYLGAGLAFGALLLLRYMPADGRTRNQEG